VWIALRVTRAFICSSGSRFQSYRAMAGILPILLS
jgi:hypothetical protein